MILSLVAVVTAAEPIRLDAVEWSGLADVPAPEPKATVTDQVREALDLAGHPALPTAQVLRARVTSADCVSRQGTRSCEVAVSWALRDAATGDELYVVTTRGLGSTDEASPAPALRDAIDDATDRLLARERFASQLRAGSGARPPPVTLRACTDPAPALPAGMKAALAAAVFVEVPDGVGSGVVVSPDGWILTAAHVVRGQSGVKVRVRNGTSVPARLVALDSRQDVALLRADGEAWACLPFTPAPAEVGTELYAIGSPLGEALEFSVSKGIVSGARRAGDVRFLQTDASLNPGNSGGPLVDLSGHLLAVVSWKVAGQEVEGLGFGVPVDAVSHAFSLGFGPRSVEPDEPFLLEPLQRVVDVDDAARLPRGSGRHGGGDGGGHGGAIAAGSVLGGVGTLVVVVTWGMYAVADEMDEAEWRRLQLVNTLGWAGMAGGAGVILVPTLTSASAGAALTGRF